MVTTEGNRVQTPGPTTPTLERPTPSLQPPTEESVARPRTESRPALVGTDPLWLMSLVVSGATVASIAGLSAAVLAIVGLSGIYAMYLWAIAAIVLGAGFLTLGDVGAVWTRMFQRPQTETRPRRMGFASGVFAAWTTGLIAVVLGVLLLLFPGSFRYGAGAAIAVGVGLLWHSEVMWRVSRFTHDVFYRGMEERPLIGPLSINALSLAPVRDSIVGLVAIVLGLLAMLNIGPLTLGLVAFLIIGVALTASASTVCSASLTTFTGTSVPGQRGI